MMESQPMCWKAATAALLLAVAQASEPNSMDGIIADVADTPSTDTLPFGTSIQTLESLSSSVNTKSASPPSSYVTRSVQIITRHGQRTPNHQLPNDDRSYWPKDLGPGQLTKQGAQEMKDLGVLLRNKYVRDEKIIRSVYNRDDLYARSSDVDRCLMSGHSLLQGLYPAGDDQLPAEPHRHRAGCLQRLR